MVNARQRTQLKWYGLILLVALLGSEWIYLTRVPIDTNTLPGEAAHANFRAPAFSLVALDGTSVSLNDLRGRVVLVNFWATWCVPCRTEMPAIEAAYQAHATHDFAVVAINVGEDDATVRQFVDEFHLTFPILLDHDMTVVQQYQVQALPTSLFIDREGIIRTTSLGGMNRASIEAELARLLELGN